MRGYGLTIDRTPSPGSHLTMRSDLSHKGRGEMSRRQFKNHPTLHRVMADRLDPVAIGIPEERRII